MTELTYSASEEVLEALALPQKQIPTKYHYDSVGCGLFERITHLEEYYLTRVEGGLLRRWIPSWVEEFGPVGLVELGPGTAAKTRIILDAVAENVRDALYVPVDVSSDELISVAEKLRLEYEGLRVVPTVADIARPLTLPAALPDRSWVAFLGSTLGNFETPEAVRLLRGIARWMGASDRLLLGLDLRPGPRKSRERLERAYNDAEGVTRRFSTNVLYVLNQQVGCDFDPDGFVYVSFYDEGKGRIETYQESTREQVVSFPCGRRVELSAGERIRTEISAKYDRGVVDELFQEAGLVVDRWVEDDCGYYALLLGKIA